MAGSYDAIVYTIHLYNIIVPQNLLGVASTGTLCMTAATCQVY